MSNKYIEVIKIGNAVHKADVELFAEQTKEGQVMKGKDGAPIQIWKKYPFFASTSRGTELWVDLYFYNVRHIAPKLNEYEYLRKL